MEDGVAKALYERCQLLVGDGCGFVSQQIVVGDVLIVVIGAELAEEVGTSVVVTGEPCFVAVIIKVYLPVALQLAIIPSYNVHTCCQPGIFAQQVFLFICYSNVLLEGL